MIHEKSFCQSYTQNYTAQFDQIEFNRHNEVGSSTAQLTIFFIGVDDFHEFHHMSRSHRKQLFFSKSCK